ncbi:Cytochrome c oxidase subunit 5B, mitochondrial [Neodidymelliopsis sp. IMI 364377]|nr:Cytochrome c oxidase subunit 5B, mitochondrial [Neodidymelliopsis sp. IMI 364377]
MLRTSIVRATRSAAVMPKTAPVTSQLQQFRQAHAISNPTLAQIEQPNGGLLMHRRPPQEQADLWMTLRDRMKTDWKELTMQEKKAAYFIAFGPHGPRRPPPPDEGRKVLFLSVAVCFGAFAVFAFTRMFASPIRPRTMTKEWQEATEEYMKAQGTEPITGYKGMMVQSVSEKNLPPGQKLNDE